MGQMTQQFKHMAPPDDELKKIEAIILSMTPEERVRAVELGAREISFDKYSALQMNKRAHRRAMNLEKAS